MPGVAAIRRTYVACQERHQLITMTISAYHSKTSIILSSGILPQVLNLYRIISTLLAATRAVCTMISVSFSFRRCKSDVRLPRYGQLDDGSPISMTSPRIARGSRAISAASPRHFAVYVDLLRLLISRQFIVRSGLKKSAAPHQWRAVASRLCMKNEGRHMTSPSRAPLRLATPVAA